MTTQNISPGSYYHRHIKPSDTNSHTALDGIYSNEIPTTAKPINNPSSWLIATEYYGAQSDIGPGDQVLIIWIRTTANKRHLGAYTGMRIANVDSHHVGGLHAGNVPHPVTKRQLERSHTTVQRAKQDQVETAKRVRAKRLARLRRGIVNG